MKPVEVGDPAPEFISTASDGSQISLADFKGRQPVVIFFYPADGSPICTQEACAFRNTYADFVKLGAALIGVSGDSDDSHRSFAASYRLPYPMIADEDGALRRLFGVPNTMLVIPGRVTYVIDQNGIVRLKYNSQLFGRQHVQEALMVVRQLTASISH